jgi:hypothetical protein
MLFSLRAVVRGSLGAVWERGKILFILSPLQLGQKLSSEGSNLKAWLVESLCEARPCLDGVIMIGSLMNPISYNRVADISN